jgi:hypothetical protein
MKNFFLFVWLLFWASPLAFAGGIEATLSQAMATAGFSAEQVARVQNIIETAQQKGLPAEAVSSKVYEGIAKHVAPDRIIRALNRVTSRYEYGYSQARRLAEEKKQIADLGNTMTAGIAAVLTRQDSAKLVNSLQARSGQLNREELYLLAEETMLTARDLSRQGIPSATTAELVGKAVQKGFVARDMRTMRNAFNLQGRAGNRESLARDYSVAIEHGVQACDLAGQSAGAREGGGGHGSGNGDSGGAGGAGGSGGGNSGGSGNGGGHH